MGFCGPDSIKNRRSRVPCADFPSLSRLKMLLSTRIVFQFAARTTLARDWRVVNVPDDESNNVNFIDLYVKIVEHSLDALEPLILPEDKKNAPIRVQIGRSQNASDFQDVPLTVKVSDALALFGVYVKFFVQCEEPPCSSTSIPGSGRNAFEVSIFLISGNVYACVAKMKAF